MPFMEAHQPGGSYIPIKAWVGQDKLEPIKIDLKPQDTDLPEWKAAYKPKRMLRIKAMKLPMDWIRTRDRFKIPLLL